MLDHRFYPVISLDEKRAGELKKSDNFKSEKFLVLDFKEVQNEYNVIFIDDTKKFTVLNVDKVKFEGFVSSEDAHLFLPAMESLEQTQQEEQTQEQPTKRGRKAKE